MESKTAQLIIDSSERNVDLYYLTKFYVIDPVLYIRTNKESLIVVSDLEFSRAKEKAKNCHVKTYNELNKIYGNKESDSLILAALNYFKHHKIKSLIVPETFPSIYFENLKNKKYRLRVKKDPFAQNRTIKTDDEKLKIIDVIKKTEEALSQVVCILKESKIQGEKVFFEGKPLTSQILKKIMFDALYENNCLALHTIISSGYDTCMPHKEGSGEIFANVPIIIDVYPRSLDSFFYADITRTFVKGKASLKIKKMYDAVLKAQEYSISKISSNINGKKIYDGVVKMFGDLGFETRIKDGKPQGFIHGVGHGLGLEIHECFRIKNHNYILREGNVTTVEPGLYYEDSGGVRIEDVVYVTKNGCEVLTSFPKFLEID